MRTLCTAPSSIRLMFLHAALVRRIVVADGVEEPAIDLVNDLQVTRNAVLEPGHRPLLERLRQERVVGVGQASVA